MRRKTFLQSKAAQHTPLRDKPLLRPAAAAFVDIHCHCLPGRDDGPATTEQTLALCRALASDGVRDVIATPHQLGRYEGRNAAAGIRQAVSDLNFDLTRLGVPLTVSPGADVRVDERLPQMLDDGTVLTLADRRRYLLLEMPHDVFIDISYLLEMLRDRGLRAIISHPERNPLMARHPDLLRSCLEKRAVLQITAGSLVGDFGPLAERSAWGFLADGAEVVVATDAHNLTDRRPRMLAAYALIRDRLGAAAAHRMCRDNPARILAGSDLEASAGPGLREACT